MILDPKVLLRYAELSNLVYSRDVKLLAAGCEKLGVVYLGLVTNGNGGEDQGDCQIMLAGLADGRVCLATRGTEVTGDEGPSWFELLDDVRFVGKSFGAGRSAPEGVVDPLMGCLPGLFELLPPRAKLVLVGHSLGGGRTEALPPFLRAVDPNPEGVSFGGIRSGNDAFCTFAWPDPARLTRVIAEDDFAPTHGEGWTHRDPTALWLHQGKLIPNVQQGPTSILLPHCRTDHSIDQSYIARLRPLAAVT